MSTEYRNKKKTPTLADKIGCLCHYIPAELVSENSFNEILSLCSLYDFHTADNLVFETHFNDDSGKADFSFGVDKGVIKQLKAGIYHEPEPGIFEKNLIMQDIFKNWEDSFLDRNLDSLWLEYDHKGKLSNALPDIIFHPFNKENAGHETIKAGNFALFRKIIELYDRDFIADELLKNLERCFTHVNDKNRSLGIGFPFGRKDKKLRLGISFDTKEEMFAYLEKIGLPYQNKLDCLVAELSSFCSYLLLHLDLTSFIHPRIGLEFRQADNDILCIEKQDVWYPFLDYLVYNKYSSQTKASSLKKWIGQSREIMNPELNNYLVKRLVYEIKLVYQPEMDLFFKGYFGFSFFHII